MAETTLTDGQRRLLQNLAAQTMAEAFVSAPACIRFQAQGGTASGFLYRDAVNSIVYAVRRENPQAFAEFGDGYFRQSAETLLKRFLTTKT